MVAVTTRIVEEAAELLAGVNRPCVLTGAGMSRESGIPTFRDGKDSLWSQVDYRKVASVAALHENPQQVWDFHEGFRETVRLARPNAGHHALVDLERLFFPDMPILTQNVDNLHERAGSSIVTHLHGQLEYNRCSRYCRGVPSIVNQAEIDWSSGEKPPLCPYCGSMMRPYVIFFGEFLHSEPLKQAEKAINKADLLMIIGTSGVVAPASDMVEQAKKAGALLIEINPKPSAITSLVDLWIPKSCGEALPELVSTLIEKVNHDGN